MKSFFLDHIGLSHPRRFERTIAFFVAGVLGLVVGAVAMRLILKDEFHFNSPRFWYFTYLAALLLLALACTRLPRLTMVLLSLASLEIGLGFGTALLYKLRLSSSETLFARDYVRPHYDWHPLLQVRQVPTAVARSTREVAYVNSERRRGRERAPQELKSKSVVALIGGSTTLDILSREGETWAEHLERLLGADRFAVINHGVSGYTTSEHVIQTAFYQDSFGVPANCAVYYIGWNDLRNAHVRDLDPAYATNHLVGQIDALDARRINGPALSVSPILSFLAKLAILAFDTVRPPAPIHSDGGKGPDPALETIYARNIATISAINRGRGIRTVWIGQVMNKASLKEDQMEGWLPFVRDSEIPTMIAWLNAILKREAERLGDTYIDVPAGALAPEDFGDVGHFSPSGSRKFAEQIAPEVGRACAGDSPAR
jgi:lysophospholipase L1-like esterase